VRGNSVFFGSLGYRAADAARGRDGAGALLSAGRIELHEHHNVEAPTLREAQEMFVKRIVGHVLELHGTPGANGETAKSQRIGKKPLHAVLSLNTIQELEGSRNIRRRRILSIVTPAELLRLKSKQAKTKTGGNSSSSSSSAGLLPKNVLRDVKRARAAICVEMLFNAQAPSSTASGDENVYQIYVPLSKICTMRWVSTKQKNTVRPRVAHLPRMLISLSLLFFSLTPLLSLHLLLFSPLLSSHLSFLQGSEEEDTDSSDDEDGVEGGRHASAAGAGPAPEAERARVVFTKKAHALAFCNGDAIVDVAEEAEEEAEAEEGGMPAAVAAAKAKAADTAAIAVRVLEMDIATAASDGDRESVYAHLLVLALVHGGPNPPSLRGAEEIHFDGRPHHPRRWSADAVEQGVRAGVRMVSSVAPTLRRISEALSCAVSLLLLVD
jgi:hypothetical protein